MSPTPDPTDAVSARLSRLEEDLAFSDRTAEELSRQVFALHKRLDEAVARLTRIEAAIRQPPNEADAPPGETG